MNTLNILSYILFVPFLSGVISTLFCGYHSKKTRIPGLLFHSVLPTPELNLSHFSSKAFKKCMTIFADLHIKPITLSEAQHSDFTSDPVQKCLLTFDDGLENVFQYAIPCLDAYGFRGTIFCVAGFIDKSSTWDVYRSLRHLSKQQIRQLSDTGHEIGSHSLTHANLPFLNDTDLISELRDSRRLLEDITGRQVTSLSFPHGSWNKRVWECACEMGYQSATLYRGHSLATERMFPVLSAGRFDSASDIIRRISTTSFNFSSSIAASRIASHFAKGTPVWKFRKNYSII